MTLREQAIEAMAKSGWLMGEWEDSPYRKSKEERLDDSEAQLDALLDLLDTQHRLEHECFICEGFGEVAHDQDCDQCVLDGGAAHAEPCPECGGTGVLLVFEVAALRGETET